MGGKLATQLFHSTDVVAMNRVRFREVLGLEIRYKNRV